MLLVVSTSTMKFVVIVSRPCCHVIAVAMITISIAGVITSDILVVRTAMHFTVSLSMNTGILNTSTIALSQVSLYRLFIPMTVRTVVRTTYCCWYH